MVDNRRYRWSAELSNFLKEMTSKYRLINEDGLSITFTFEKHIVDRLLDRRIDKTTLSAMVTRLIKYHLCEVLFLHSLNPNVGIDLWMEDYLLGITVQKVSEVHYRIKLRTIFVARRSNRQVNNYFKIKL